VAEVSLAELQIEVPDALLGLLIGWVEPQLLLVIRKLGRFQEILRPDVEAAQDHRETD